MIAPTVSIVIRAKNEAALIGECLRKIAEQDYPGSVEVIVIDSGSRDKTVAIARGFPGVRVVEIPSAEFNYGETLNLGVRLATGEYVVALSAHCVPLDNGWLSALVAPLDNDTRIGGTFGRQIAWPEAGLYENYMLNWAGPVDRIQDSCYPDPFKALYSNANSCFRRSLALAHPFALVTYAEDRIWANTILNLGHAILYVSGAAVYHSHDRSIRDYFRVGYAVGKARLTICPPGQLKTPLWYGVKEFLVRFRRWYHLASHRYSCGRAKAFLIAIKTLAHEIGFDLGVRCVARQKHLA